MSNILVDEYPLLILPKLAVALGLNDAIVLRQVYYWLKNAEEQNRINNFRDGRWWVYNSKTEWKENFPFWSESTVWRSLTSLRQKGLLIATGEYNKNKYDRTLWYTIDYEKIREIEEKINEQTVSQSDANDDVTLTEEVCHDDVNDFTKTTTNYSQDEQANSQVDIMVNSMTISPIPETTNENIAETTPENTAKITTKNSTEINTRPDGSQGFSVDSEDQNQPEDENREPDKFDLMTKEELRKLFEPYGGEEPPDELTVEEENQKLTEMGIVGIDPFGFDDMSYEEYFQALPKIREMLKAEGINAPVDWVIATSRERGVDHIREENERRQELKRQGRDLELEQAVANVRSWMPPETVELAVVFVEKTRMTPVVSDRRAWMKAFSDMHKKGVIPKDLKSGIGRMKEKGLMIKSPFSVATSAVNQMGIRKVEEDRYKIG